MKLHRYFGKLFAAMLIVIFNSNLTNAEPSVLVAAQQAVEAALKAETAVKIAIPRGAVMAFNIEECPQGWKLFEPAMGRVIVGSGSGNRDPKDEILSDRELGSIGGVEKHILIVPEMPSHNHGGVTGSVGSKVSYPATPKVSPAGRFTGDNVFTNEPHSHSIAAEGGNSGHNNMQPFVVLTYCQRL